MAVMDPAGKPFSLPQCSWRYCESRRCVSPARAATAMLNSASALNTHLSNQCLVRRPSGKILKFFNNNLCVFLHRALIAGHHVKEKLKRLLARGRYTGSENVFRNERRPSVD